MPQPSIWNTIDRFLLKKIVGAPDCALRIRQNKSIEVSLRVSFADPRPSLTVFTLLILLAGTTSGSTSEDPRIDPGLGRDRR